MAKVVTFEKHSAEVDETFLQKFYNLTQCGTVFNFSPVIVECLGLLCFVITSRVVCVNL